MLVKLQTRDHIHVTGHEAEARTRETIPYANGVVGRARDDFRVVELNANDSAGMLSQRSSTAGGGEVPDLDACVLRAGDEDGPVELKAANAVRVAGKRQNCE